MSTQEAPKKIERIEELPLHKEILSGEFAQKWIKLALSDDNPRVTAADVKTFLTKVLDLPCECVCWATDPVYAALATRIQLGQKVALNEWNEKDIPDEWIDANMDKASSINPISEGYCRYGQHDATWVANLLAYEGTHIDLTEVQLYEPIVRGSNWWFYVDGIAIMTPPHAPKFDMEHQLHCEDGPAIWSFYALHGVVLPAEYEWIVKECEELTREKIDSIENAEIRRVTITTYPGAYVQGDPTQTDEFGDLYKLENEEFALVKVKDTYSDRRYWLRVPPNVTTAKEGVASTFGMSTDDYKPVAES